MAVVFSGHGDGSAVQGVSAVEMGRQQIGDGAVILLQNGFAPAVPVSVFKRDVQGVKFQIAAGGDR